MSRLVQALLTGFLITLILDGLIFIGLFANYITFYEIKLFYKPFFANHQNIYIFTFLSIFFGLIFTYLKSTKLKLMIFGVLFLLSFSTLIPYIGNTLGGKLFMKKSVTLQDSKYLYSGNIYYEGQNTITFYDTDVNKIITINKKDLKR